MSESARKIDINGFWSVDDNPISKIGVYQYLGSSMGVKDLDPDKIYNVLRPEEELSSKKFLESVKLIPWLDNHEMIGEGATPAEEKGVEGTTGEDVYYNNGTVFSNLKLFSKDLADKVKNMKNELSLAYRCRYEQKTGIYKGQSYDFIQRDLIGNHLASVENGRMGSSVAVLDENDIHNTKSEEEKVDKKAEYKEMMDGMMSGMKEMVGNAVDEAMTKYSKDKYEEEKEKDTSDKKDNDKDKEKSKDYAKDTMDSMEKEISILKAENVAIKEKESLIARDSLAEDISFHTGTFDHSDMTIKDVAKYGAKHFGLDITDNVVVPLVKSWVANIKAPSPAQFAMDQNINSGQSATSKYLEEKR